MRFNILLEADARQKSFAAIKKAAAGVYPGGAFDDFTSLDLDELKAVAGMEPTEPHEYALVSVAKALLRDASYMLKGRPYHKARGLSRAFREVYHGGVELIEVTEPQEE